VITLSYSQQIWERFIVVEGMDGAGTTTQSNLLEANLRHRGWDVFASMEPTAGLIGTMIKQIMRGRLRAAATREHTERQLAFLFAADRQDHLHNDVDGIAGQLARGPRAVALTTRYLFSSHVYNGSSPEMRLLVNRLNEDFPLPQLVIYLHVPLSVAMARLASREVREYYENEEELARVSKAYDAALAPLGDRVLRFESVGDPRELAERIAEQVHQRLS
jgi:dTMP kinase